MTTGPGGQTSDLGAPYARQAGQGSSVWSMGCPFSVLAASDETDGRFGLIEMLAPRGLEPSRHLHYHDDEGFYVLAGNATFYVGEETYEAGRGTFVFGPRGLPHSYNLHTDGVRMLAIVALGGIEQHLRPPASPSRPRLQLCHRPPESPTRPSLRRWPKILLATAPSSSVLPDYSSGGRAALELRRSPSARSSSQNKPRPKSMLLLHQPYTIPPKTTINDQQPHTPESRLNEQTIGLLRTTINNPSRTQNPVPREGSVGSSPTSGTDAFGSSRHYKPGLRGPGAGLGRRFVLGPSGPYPIRTLMAHLRYPAGAGVYPVRHERIPVVLAPAYLVGRVAPVGERREGEDRHEREEDHGGDAERHYRQDDRDYEVRYEDRDLYAT